MKNNRAFRLNAGLSSAILLIAVLALSVFSIFTAKNALNDLNSCKIIRDSVVEYYEADAKCAEILATVHFLSIETDNADAAIGEKIKEIKYCDKVEDNKAFFTVWKNDSTDIKLTIYSPSGLFSDSYIVEEKMISGQGQEGKWN